MRLVPASYPYAAELLRPRKRVSPVTGAPETSDAPDTPATDASDGEDGDGEPPRHDPPASSSASLAFYAVISSAEWADDDESRPQD